MSDADLLERAAALAAPWMTFPNPRVGCVITDRDGVVVGEGAHHAVGGPHAEVHALADAGDRARGGTAYVTLEPCAHRGRTGPCAEALIAAGVARVVIAVADPNPVAAGGAEVLRRAGVAVELVPSPAAAAVNEHWLHAMRHGRPFVTLKVAASLDGRVAAASGGETAISNAASRRRVHALRGRVDAVLVSTGTAVIDDPSLTARDVPVQRQPARYVMGHRALPAGLRLLQGDAPARQLHTHDPAEALALLQADQVRHLLVEAGPTLARAFIGAGLVDELLWVTAPRVLGSGPLALGAEPLATAVRWVSVALDDVEGDLWRTLRPAAPVSAAP